MIDGLGNQAEFDTYERICYCCHQVHKRVKSGKYRGLFTADMTGRYGAQTVEIYHIKDRHTCVVRLSEYSS